MSELTPEKRKEILLMVIDGLKQKVEEHTIGDMLIDADERITPIYDVGKTEPVSIMSSGFRYTIEVEYLDQPGG